MSRFNESNISINKQLLVTNAIANAGLRVR
jgi:hypothetical protein